MRATIEIPAELSARLDRPTAPGARPAETRLRVQVVFTQSGPTLAALRAAADLARDLDVHVELIRTQAVPFPAPLDCPPVSAEFVGDRLRELATRASAKAAIVVCMCRDSRDALRRLLQPGSLVVIGGRRRWWRTREQRLAQRLRGEGHRVVFVAADDERDVEQRKNAELKPLRRGTQIHWGAVRASGRGTFEP